LLVDVEIAIDKNIRTEVSISEVTQSIAKGHLLIDIKVAIDEQVGAEEGIS
jgi:hypothetical protein